MLKGGYTSRKMELQTLGEVRLSAGSKVASARWKIARRMKLYQAASLGLIEPATSGPTRTPGKKLSLKPRYGKQRLG